MNSNLIPSDVLNVPVNPLSAKLYKMVKHTQAIHRLLPTNCLSVFDHFVGLSNTYDGAFVAKIASGF